MIGSLFLHGCILLGILASAAPVSSRDEGQPAGAQVQAPPPIDPAERFVPRTPRTAEDIERFDTLRLYAAARALEARREWSQAVELLEQARELEPESVAILRRLSRLYFGLGREEGIKKGLEAGLAAIEADPEDSETIRRLVRHYRTANAEEEAERLLRSVLDDPDLPAFSLARLVVLHELGRLYADAQRFDKAVEPFDRLVEALDTREAARLTPAQIQDVLGEDEADAYRRFGEAFFNAGRFNLAIKALRRSLAYDPDSQATPLYLAQALLRDNQAEQALALLEPIIADRPPGRVTYDVLAQILTALGRADEIIPRLEKAAEADPSNFLLRFALAERYEAGGRRDDARRLYRTLTSDMPDLQGMSALAQSLREQGKLEELIRLLETARSQRGGRMAIDAQLRLIGTDPELSGAILETGLEMLRDDPPRLGPAGLDILSEIASRADRPEQRVELDRLSLERDRTPQNYLELADSLVAAGRPGEAVDTFAELLEAFPELQNEPQLLARMAELQFDAGRIEQALASGRKILERQPTDLPAIQLVGYALQKLGRFDEAIALYEQIPERFAGNPEAIRLAKIWQANALASADRFEEGEAILLQLLEERPDDPWLNNDLGYLWAERGINLERAEQMIRKAVEADPSNSAYLDSLGWVLYKQGNPEEALPHLEEAVRLRPSAVNLDHLGDVYFVLDRPEDARNAWRRAASMAEDADPPDPTLDAIREKLRAGAIAPPPPLAPAPRGSPDPESDTEMAGHSHAANVAARKNAVDAKRGKLFSKLCRAIYVAARTGGADPATNLRLRYAIDKARSLSCPKDNIERSIKKATGELGAENYEEVIYEGYGPGGVAVLCEILTDNRNRTAGEVRRAFDICGGNLGSTGCVSYLFDYKGLFLVEQSKVEEDRLMEIALEAGADDLKRDGDYYVITCDPKAFDDVRKALEDHEIPTESAETSYLPQTTVDLDVENGKKMLKLRDLLDDNDDVQNIYSNENIPEEALAS